MKEVTHIEVWKETRDTIKYLAKKEGVSMKKFIDMLAIEAFKKNKRL